MPKQLIDVCPAPNSALRSRGSDRGVSDQYQSLPHDICRAPAPQRRVWGWTNVDQLLRQRFRRLGLSLRVCHARGFEGSPRQVGPPLSRDCRSANGPRQGPAEAFQRTGAIIGGWQARDQPDSFGRHTGLQCRIDDFRDAFECSIPDVREPGDPCG